MLFSKHPGIFISVIVHGEKLTWFCFNRLYIDGPFGSPSEEVFNYEVSLCVAGGIGVTPFASVLNTLLYVHFLSV